MLPSQSTPAIVLRSRPYGESDKIVSFITENFGKLTGIAKGAMRSRRRFANSLEPFSLVNLRFHERPHSNLVFIAGADLMVGFRRLSDSLETISYASYFVEITEGLIAEREESSAVYRHLYDALCRLEKSGASLRFLTAFELKLLNLAGYRPVLDGCKICHHICADEGEEQWYFSPADGSLLCHSCSRSRRDILPLGNAAVEVLRALQEEAPILADNLLLPTSVIKEIRAVAQRFIQYHMVRELKSAQFLYQFSFMQLRAG